MLLLLLESLLLLASRLRQPFLLLLASFKFLMVSCCWSLCYCWCSWWNQWWCWRFCCSFWTCCCFTYWVVEWDVFHYQTIAVGLDFLCYGTIRISTIETKAQTFRYRSLLSEQNQNVLIWSACNRNKIGTFLSAPKLFKIKSKRFSDFLKFKNETRTKPS